MDEVKFIIDVLDSLRKLPDQCTPEVLAEREKIDARYQQLKKENTSAIDSARIAKAEWLNDYLITHSRTGA